MESQKNDEVVRESAIFAALSPRGYSRQSGNPRCSAPGDTGATPAGSLPPVNPRDVNSTFRLPGQSQTSKTPQTLMMSIPMTTNECLLVWKFLCDWVKTQVAMEVPASIPGFGTFYVRVQSLGIRIILFEPDKHFLSKYCVQVDSEIPDPALIATLPSATPSFESTALTSGRNRSPSIVGLGEVFTFSFVEMASCCGNAVDAARAQEWLAVVIHKLGSAMSQCGRVELDIGVGVIVCSDRVIQRYLVPRDSRSSSRFEYEIRRGESVVKRNLRAQAALQTMQSPKPSPASKIKYSFLSGSAFAASIQVNPVLDRSKDVPDFSFGPPNPRPPASSFVPIGLDTGARSSPRSTQLQKRYQRTASPRVSRISAMRESAAEDERMSDNTLPMQKQTEDSRVPQLFDRLSRTFCVEPDQNVSYLQPSNRIGSNFTKTAAFLMTEKAASQFGHQTQVSGGLVFVDRPVMDRHLLRVQRKEVLQDSTSEQRYFEYLSDNQLIDRCYLALLPPDLEARVVSSAVKYVVGPSNVQIEKVLEVAHRAFVDNYYVSTKKAILNYLLMREVSCERLGIPKGVPAHALLPSKWKWGSSDGPNGCIGDLKTLVVNRKSRPINTSVSKRAKTSHVAYKSEGSSRIEAVRGKVVCRKRVQSKLMSLLILSNPQVRALRYMWHDLQTSVSLVNLPTVQGLSDAIEPMDIIEFERAQLAFSAKTKAYMMENWYMKTKMMFESALRAETFSIHASEAAVSYRLRHLFDTVAAVMSLQIRSLIKKSIQTYVNFFELFGELDNQNSGSQQRSHRRPAYSGLLTTLTLQGGQIQFRDPLIDIPSRLLNVLHNIPKLFYNLGRIETQFDEPLVLSNSSSPFLWNVASQEDDIVVATIRIRSIIEQNLKHLRKLQADYDVYALTHRYVNSVDCFHLEENSELESYRTEMERVQATAMQLAIDNRHSQHLGLFSVDCRYVNTKLYTELGQWTICLLQAFEQRTGRMNAELRQQYKEIAARLAKKPLDLYELVDAEAFILSLKSTTLQELQEKSNTIKQRLRFLLFERENMHVGDVASNAPLDASARENEVSLAEFRLSVDLLSSTAKTVKWRSHIEKLLKEAELQLVNERSRIEAMFIAKRSRFQAEIEEFEGEVRGFAKKGDLRHAATYVVQLAKLKENMFIFRHALETIIKEEQKLQWKPTDFGKLDDIAEEIAPYEKLWKTVREFREMNSRWLRGNVFELPGKEGLQTLQQMLTVVANVSSVLLLCSAAAAITAEAVRKQMTDFRENIRLIVAIQNPAMKERHMKAVSTLIGLDFSSGEAVTLLKLLENGAFEMIGNIVDISSNATQEQQIERALNEMGDEWGATSFEFVPAKHPISFGVVLAPFMATEDSESEVWNVTLDKTCAERIVSLMDDHLLRLQTLSCMAHAGPFLKEIALWQTFASETGQVVEGLTLIEQLWYKLTPLFAANIVETNSKESQLFADAAHLYRSTHATILHQPICKGYFPQSSTSQNSEKETVPLSPSAVLISGLNDCRELLETVRGGVRMGFDVKRSSFARFYFLSDAELVTALALGRVPSNVKLWKALSRCFPGISGVQTNAANEITALLSSVGEPFPLGSPIVTTDTPMPTWLAKVESSMTTILHASIRAACNDLPRKEFRKWCLIWPEQSLVAAIQYLWTIESEQAYQNVNQRRAWTELTINVDQNLDAVSKEIKVTAYPHAKVALGNVMLLLTQLRDVSYKVLRELSGTWIKENFEDPRELTGNIQQSALPRFRPSLTWIAQPRYYFIENVLSVTMMTSSFLPYGLEYLGNGAPGILVTPLTLRCYHAIAQAASTMAKGACLEGAAGTGKSTICHQLARVCGRLYVIFQCANRKLLFDDLVNFIKATASSGAWLCMDNLQLLDATSVTMVTLLCSQVMTNVAARHAQCTLVGDKVRLRRGALFFVTLTTRHNLKISALTSPQNKALLQNARYFFRTIVVQSPDIEKLAEFEFQSSRFVHASQLAKLLSSALTAFERGFELLNNPTETLEEMNVRGTRLANLRHVKSVVKRAAELNKLEKEQRRQTRKSILITPDADESDDVAAAEERLSNDVVDEKRDEEIMEYQHLCLSLREHLGAMMSSANLHLIDAIIRDVFEPALGRDLLMSKSTDGSSILSNFHLSATKNLEHDVENYVRTTESSWKHFGEEFGLKTIQLLQTMRKHRVVVLSGKLQSGKTSLYASLSQALSHIPRIKSEDRSNSACGLSVIVESSDTTLVAPIRCVVVCPRALRLGQLIDLEADRHSQTVFAKLVGEAKTIFKAEQGTHTWLVFDGDLDALWSEQILYTVDEPQDDCPGNKKGIQLSSGKYFLIPNYVRVIMETTTLTHASPSFITRVGSVHMNGDPRNIDGHDCEKVYEIWKTLRRAEFERNAEAIFSALDTLVAETVVASVVFVNSSFQSCRGGNQGLERVQWTLALFHSAIQQSWSKFCALTSDKQRSSAVHCFFLQALVWGVGSTANALERQKYHLFLYDLILHGPNNEQSTLKRLVMLYFPPGTVIESQSTSAGGNKTGSDQSISSGGSNSRMRTIYDYGFSVEFGSRWLPWTEYYNRWVQMLPSGSPPTASSSESPKSQLKCLVVPTEATTAAICLSGQLLLANYPTILSGPRDSGRTVCGTAWLLLSAALSATPTVSNVISHSSPSFQPESSNAGTGDTAESASEDVMGAEKVYAGFYTRASDILRQFDITLQRIRIERKENAKLKALAARTVGSNPGLTTAPAPQNDTNTVYVFVDDVHCLDTDQRMDSATELLRMLAEYESVVDPTTNLLTLCPNILPFITLQTPVPGTKNGPKGNRALERLVSRFVPITLQALSDFDLSSICESFTSSVLALKDSTGSPRSQGSAASNQLKEAGQLQSIIIKASLKLFRLLTSNNDFTIFGRAAAFQPIKLHYNYHAAQLFQIVKSVCCEIRPTLALTEKPTLARLWSHESVRVLGDGIVERKESFALHRRVIDIALVSFGVAEDEFFPAPSEPAALQNSTVAQNWLANDLNFSFIGDTNTGVSYRNGYHEVNGMTNVELAVEKSMKTMHHADASNSHSPEALELVLCSYVVKHVLRISRLLRMKRKAILLLGECRRKLVSITRLACFVCKKASTVYHMPTQESTDTNSANDTDTIDGDADNSKWNTVLRAVMLNSVRTRDTSLVFIVKDAKLDPASYFYQTLDRFLGGHSLPSDVVAYEDLDDDILLILRESIHRERTPPHNNRGGIHQQSMSPAPPVLRSKRAILGHFFRHVRQKLQFVLIFAPSLRPWQDNDCSRTVGWASILWRFPNILKCCDFNYIGEWPPDTLVTVAHKCLTKFPVTSDVQLSKRYAEAAVQIYTTTSRFLECHSRNGAPRFSENSTDHESATNEANERDQVSINSTSWNCRVPSFLQVDTGMLVDHLALFASQYHSLEGTISANLVRYKTGVEFIDQTARMLQTEQAQAELLLPEVRHKTDMRRRMSGSLEREKITAEKLTRGLELAATLAATQRERLATVTQEYQDLITDSRDMFNQMRGTLHEFYDAFDGEEDEGNANKDKNEDEHKAGPDVKEGGNFEETMENVDDPDSIKEVDTRHRLRTLVRNFAALERIPSSIYQLSECLGVMIGIEPVEGRDEMDPDEIIMNYWKNVSVGMKTAAFWNKLMMFDVPNHATEKMVSIVLPISEAPDFNKDLFVTVHEVAGVLCEWVQKCAVFAQDFILARPKFAQLEREQELLKEAEAQVVRSKMEIYNQSTASRQTNELRELTEMERLRADEKLQDTTSLLHLTNAAWKVLSSTRETWQRMFDFYSEFAMYWRGDLLLATAALSYTSCLSHSLRLQLYQRWKEAIPNSLVIPSPFRRPLHEVFLVRGPELAKMKLNGLPANDESALENAVIALHSYRSPLLIDPYGVATDWLKSQLSSQKFAILPANKTTTDAAVWKEVAMSIKGESILVLTDICREIMEGLHSFIGAKRRALFDAVNHDNSASNRNSVGYRCWCIPPGEVTHKEGRPSSPGKTDGSLSTEQPIFEFDSDACEIFFIYTDTNTLPSWMSGYLSQLTVIQFEMTNPLVETQALQKLLESQGRLRELTETRALQHDMVVCDEQIYGLEEELLEFFSTEKPEQVYADNSKALRIVANRSSVNTLESTKAEAESKVQLHWGTLMIYTAVAKRCLDAIWAWREFNFVIRNDDIHYEETLTLSAIWRLLIRAGETSSKGDGNLEEVMACFTSYLQQCVVMNLPDEDRLLFRFLLAFRIWQRRVEDENVSAEDASNSQSRRSTDMELLGRLLALLSSKTDRNSHDMRRPTSNNLLELRPTGVKASSWSSICCLAESSKELQQFISRMNNLEDGQAAWKALMDLGSKCSSEWEIPVPLGSFTRLCIAIAIHPHRLMCEIEDFAGRELQRLHTVPVTLTQSSVLTTEANTPSLSTVVAAAAHTAMAQAPHRHHDLFYMWQSFSRSTAPLVVVCPPSIDFIDEVSNVARRAGAIIDATNTIQLLLADEVVFKNILLLAMGKGEWVVLPNLQTCRYRFAQLSAIYESLKDARIHSDFRLWISIASHDESMRQVDFDTMHISRIATRRKWGTGFLSLKRSLHHTFAILKHDMEELAGLNEYEQQCMKQVGVFHALVSSRDHFSFAEWKGEGAFGDTELSAVFRSLAALRTQKEVFAKDVPNTSEIGTWRATTLRGVISNVYGSKLRAPRDQRLIRCCINLVLNAWPTALDEGQLDSTAIVAQMTIPEAVFAIEKLAAVPWVSIVSAIPLLWVSESNGPPLSNDALALGMPVIDGIWDPHRLRKDRQMNFVTQLKILAANQGCQVTTRLMLPRPSPITGVLQTLELIAAFRKDLEGVELPQDGDFEYHKPILALVYRERLTLDQIRMVILRDIERLEAVSTRGLSLDFVTWQLFNEIRENSTPACWMGLLRLPVLHTDTVQEWSLDKFQHVLLDRFNTMASWQEPQDGPHKLRLDTFLDTKCVFEAVHQHFVRNHAGNTICSSDCLVVVSMFEDSPRLALPVKENVIYFSGVRAMGHLQLQTIDVKGYHRRAPISHEGVPVILQVTSSCRPGPSEEMVKDTKRVEFSCPVFPGTRGLEHCSIRVMSALPQDQLIFSGASLQLQTTE